MRYQFIAPLISLFPWSISMFLFVYSLITALTVKYLTQRFIMEYDPYIDGKYSKLDMVGNEPVIIRVWDTYTHSGVSSSVPISILYVYLHSLKGKQLPNWECKCHHVSFILFHLSSMQNNVHLLLLWSGHDSIRVLFLKYCTDTSHPGAGKVWVLRLYQLLSLDRLT